MSARRISPPRVDPRATRSPRPPAELAGSSNAYRQLSFILGEEADLVVEGLSLEGEFAQAASGAKFRTPPVAATLSMWSRGWLARLQALHALEWGDYSSAAVLVRAACDFGAAAIALLTSDAAEWRTWFEGDGFGEVPSLHASEFRLHPFRSAESLASVPALGTTYRESSALALPHFGSTALLVASESNRERYAATFGDRDFHLGLAELGLGWLLTLGRVHWELVEQHPSGLPHVPDGVTTWTERAGRALGRKDRCRIEAVEHDGVERFLVVNWRREPRSPMRRVLL